jgi:hypothetical protein
MEYAAGGNLMEYIDKISEIKKKEGTCMDMIVFTYILNFIYMCVFTYMCGVYCSGKSRETY